MIKKRDSILKPLSKKNVCTDPKDQVLLARKPSQVLQEFLKEKPKFTSFSEWLESKGYWIVKIEKDGIQNED